MGNKIGLSKAGHRYAAAYAAQYRKKDLIEALKLYKGVMHTHPNTEEAEYSRSQILNIISGVVPDQELLDAQVELALIHLNDEEPAGAEKTAVEPL